MNNETGVTVFIKHERAVEIYFNGQTIPVGRDVVVSWSDALRLLQSSYFNITIKSVSKIPYNQSSWTNKRIYGLTANADTESGFGNCTTNLLRQSIKNNYDVRWLGVGNNVADLNRLIHKPIPSDIGMVWHEQPNDRWDQNPFERNIAITPFETTQIPASWVPRLNKMNAVFVPSKQNVEMMHDSGIIVPIELIHWGVDPKLFHYVPREQDNLFTFGINGALTKRKGVDLLIKAFQRAFPLYNGQYKDVRLICKTSKSQFPFLPTPPDPRIELIGIHTSEHIDVLKKFHARIDVGVYPFTGEGFGLCPLETMATGRPVVVTNWSGPVDYVTPETGWTLPYKLVPAADFQLKVYHEYCGDWAEVSEEALVEMLRYLYNHKEEVRVKGEAAAKYVADQWTWEAQIPLYFNALNRHLG
jgi:glycosyltransferase involved in cell wall biosynthesis